MAHKKAGGSTSNIHDSNAQRLGVKVFGGQVCKAGGVLVRQKGTRFFPGENVSFGKDHTLFSKTAGTVRFSVRKKHKFNGTLQRTQFVHVKPFKKASISSKLSEIKHETKKKS